MKYNIGTIIKFSSGAHLGITGCRAIITDYSDFNGYNVKMLEGREKDRIYSRCTGCNFIFDSDGHNRNGANKT